LLCLGLYRVNLTEEEIEEVQPFLPSTKEEPEQPQAAQNATTIQRTTTALIHTVIPKLLST